MPGDRLVELFDLFCECFSLENCNSLQIIHLHGGFVLFVLSHISFPRAMTDSNKANPPSSVM